MNIPVHISESLKQFFGLNILKSLNAAPDPGWKTSDPGLTFQIRNIGRNLLLWYCGGLHLVINIYFISCSCLANYGASEAVYPCVVVEKIHESF